MDFITPFPTLRTSRLLLRELIPDDLEDMIELAGFRKQDPTIDDAKDIYNRSHRGFQEQSAITWAMEYDGQLVGTIGFYRGFENETGEVGYIMKRAFQRQGFMSEALEAVIRFGFEAMQLQRITAYTDINNRASASLLVKHHFTNTGTTKDEYTIFECTPPDA